MKHNHCVFCCSVAGTEYRHLCWLLQPTTVQFVCLALSNGIVKHCYLTNFTSRINSPLLDISYENDSFHYVTTGAESEQPVGAPCYQRVGCRDHAGITCFPHSGSWQAQGGPAYICRDQRKCVFHNMGPLMKSSWKSKTNPKTWFGQVWGSNWC